MWREMFRWCPWWLPPLLFWWMLVWRYPRIFQPVHLIEDSKERWKDVEFHLIWWIAGTGCSETEYHYLWLIARECHVWWTDNAFLRSWTLKLLSASRRLLDIWSTRRQWWTFFRWMNRHNPCGRVAMTFLLLVMNAVCLTEFLAAETHEEQFWKNFSIFWSINGQ